MERRGEPELTARDRELLRLLASGRSVAEAAAALGLAGSQVRARLRRLGDKLAALGAPRRRDRPAARPPVTAEPVAVGGRPEGERLLRRTLRSAARSGRTVSAVLVQVVPAPDAPQAGSAPPRAVMRGVARTLRRSDWAADWDRDGLLAVLPDTALAGARAVAERLQGLAGRGSGALAAAVEWQPPESVDAFLTRLRRLVDEGRTRRSLERTLWTGPEGPP